MLIDMVMRTWPETIPVILKHNMQCVGCPLAIFHTVSYAAKEHNIDVIALIDELNSVITDKS